MAIKGLMRRLNEAGKIKIGCKGEEIITNFGKTMNLPRRFDHFIITTTEKGEGGNFVEDTLLMDALRSPERQPYGTYTGAVLNEDGNIVAIPIRLLYDDTDLNFPTRMACYSGGILTCEGDGEKSRKRLDDFKKDYSCPCAKSDPAYDKNDRCKPNGKLTVVIDAAGMFGQVHVFRTTSYNSITGIIGGIKLIKAATGGKISGLPLMLTVNNKTTTTPAGAQTTIQVVSICYRGSMADLQKKCLQIASENAKFLIGMKTIEEDARKMGVAEVVSDDEDRDFQEEFYPDSVINAEFETVQNDNFIKSRKQVEAENENFPEIINGGKALDQILKREVQTTNTPDNDEKILVELEDVELSKDDLCGKVQKMDLPEIVNSRDIMTDEQREMAAKSQEKVKKEMVQLGLFHRIVKELNQDEASKMVRRLDKETLIKFLETMGDADDMPAEGAKKPDYLESAERIINSDDWVNIVTAYKAKNNISDDNNSNSNGPEVEKKAEAEPEQKKVRSEIWTTNKFLIELAKLEKQPEIVSFIRKRFLDTVINGTLPPEELFALAEKLLIEDIEMKKQPVQKDPEKPVEKTTPASEPETKKEPSTQGQPMTESDPFQWDDGGPIQEMQLKHIAKLKSEMKITDPVKWGAMVGQYLDSSGNPLPLAAKMTAKQADHFLNSLDEIPF